MGNISKWVGIIIAVVVICLMFPIVLTGIGNITTAPNIGDFTGLEDLVNITPLLLWIAIIGGLGFLGFQQVRGRSRKSKNGRG